MNPLVEAAESSEHRRLVRALIDYLSLLGFVTKCAAYVGYNQCPEISGHIPDIEGTNSAGLAAIGEAKTFDDLDNDRTREQFRAFSNCTMKGGNSNGQTVPFYVAITRGHEKELAIALHELGLDTKSNIYRVSF
jgi:hypothetical protein